MRSFALSSQHELLLTAALADGERARDAYRRWAAAVSFDRLDVASQRVLPLLVANRARFEHGDEHGVDEGDDRSANGSRGAAPILARCVKVARFTWLKSQLLLARAAPGVAALQAAGVPVMALKGAAVVARAGVRLSERPMDDVDLAVPAGRAAEALDLLVEVGFSPDVPVPSAEELRRWLRFDHGVELHDDRGATIDLHWHVSSHSCSEATDAAFWSAAVEGRLGEAACLTTSVEHTIVSVIGQAMTGPAATLRWATDTAILAASCGAGGVDWDEVADAAARLHIEVALGEALDTLSHLVDVGAPPRIRRLRRRPSPGQQLERWAAGRPGPPSRPAVLAAAYMEHRRRSGSPDRDHACGDLGRFLTSWWALPGCTAVPRHLLARATGYRVAGTASDRSAVFPLLAAGDEVRFDIGGRGHAYLGRGWAQPEGHGTWSSGREATFGADLPWSSGGNGVALFLRFVPFLPERRASMRVRLIVGGRAAADWTFVGPGWRPAERTVRLLPPPASGRLRCRLVFDYPVSPDASGSQAGARPLALSINSLRVDQL